jgi:catechol 2,3-dioxygenase-like lactoylglutathione lyase family enzyme
VKVTGLHHTGLVVADLDRSLGFYRDVLGIPLRELVEDASPTMRDLTGWPDRVVRIADLELGEGRVLELIERVEHPGTSTPGSGHLALEVDDVREAWRRVTEAGHAAHSAPVTLTDAGPYWTGAVVVYVSDPDGTTVELVQAPARPASERD